VHCPQKSGYGGQCPTPLALSRGTRPTQWLPYVLFQKSNRNSILGFLTTQLLDISESLQTSDIGQYRSFEQQNPYVETRFISSERPIFYANNP
jgi:hypothetical protein